MTAYEYILRIRDKASTTLNRAAKTAGVVRRRFGLLRKETDSLKTSGAALKKTFATIFAVGSLVAFTGKVIDARAEYEKFEAVLTNTFQNADVGQGALAMITDFASKTPFQLNELTGSFVKLANRGFIPTRKSLTQLGDLAASQGKGFDQLTEAILDAQTGEFERLKEFGIKASKSGDKVRLSFKGSTKEVTNHGTAIRNAILQYGSMTGVANSMAAISKTLGGRLSNLKDKWNQFLVAVGGNGGGVLGAFITLASNGIQFLTDHLPEITLWFTLLWESIRPVVTALRDFVGSALGIEDAGSALAVFGNIMSGVLVVVDLMSTGLTTIIGWLSPFSTAVLAAGAAWAFLNLMVAISPVGWIVIAILAVVTAIGALSKYTSGWGEAWNLYVNGAKLAWEAFIATYRAHFNLMVNSFMLGLNRLKKGWYEFKELLGIGDSSANKDALAQLSRDTDARKKAIVDGYRKAIDLAKQSKASFEKIKIEVDTEGIKKDFESIKKKFSGLGKPKASTKAFDAFAANQSGIQDGSDLTGNGSKEGTTAIIGGGSKQTTFNITLEKLQEQTVIHAQSLDEGIDEMEDKVTEILLRVLNSINQLQPA